MTISMGPFAGVPLPSITVALWISRRGTRFPLAGAWVWAAASPGEQECGRQGESSTIHSTIVPQQPGIFADLLE